MSQEFWGCSGAKSGGFHGDYPILISQQKSNPTEVVMANSDKSIQLVDIEKGEIAQFNSTDFHKDKIECLKYTNLTKDYENPNNL